MTDKLISFDLESTGYTDEDGNFVEPEKAEDLAKVAMARMLPEEKNKSMVKKYKDVFLKLPNSDQPIINITIEDMVIESDLLPFKKIIVSKKFK